MLPFQWLSDRHRANVMAADCEAFLTGHLARHLEEAGQEVPAWAWMNLVAHGTGDDLLAERAVDPASYFPAGKWHEASSLLAAEVLDMTSGDGSLGELQREVLVPLELELASRVEVTSWRPEQLALAVEHALDHRRRLRKLDRLRQAAASTSPAARSSGNDGPADSRKGLWSATNRTFAGSNPRSPGVGEEETKQIKRGG